MEALVHAFSHVAVLVVWLVLARRALQAARLSPGPAPLSGADAVVVAGAALAVRAAGWVAFAGTPLYAYPLIDAQYYELWAQALATGVDPHPVFGVDPLYAHVLGGCYRLFGVTPAVPVLLGAAFGTASAVLAHRLCARVAARPIALLVGLAAALHGTALAYDLLRLKSSLSLALTLGLLESFCAASARPTAWATLVPGAFLGLGSLNGAQALFAVPVLALSLLRRASGPSRVVFLLTPALCAAGWTLAHNASGGDPFPFHAGSGMILWASNNPQANGRLTPLPYVRQATAYEVGDYVAEARRRTGRPLRASEASRYWRDEALAFWRAAPARAAWLAQHKLILLLAGSEWPDNYDHRVLSMLLPHLALPLPAWGWVAPLALAGFCLALLETRGRVIALCFALLALPFVITYSNGRLRLPLLACLWPLAALALDRLAAYPRKRWIALIIGLAVSLNLPLPLPTLAPGLVGVAEVCREAGLYDQAMELYAQALRADPDHFGALNNLGAFALAVGRADAAVRLFQRAVAVRPSSAPAWYNLGNAWRRAGRPVEALDSYARAKGEGVHPLALELKRGLAMSEAGRTAEAKAALGALLANPRPLLPYISAEELAEARAALDR